MSKKGDDISEAGEKLILDEWLDENIPEIRKRFFTDDEDGNGAYRVTDVEFDALVAMARKAEDQGIKLKNNDLVIDMARKGIKEFEAKVERYEKALRAALYQCGYIDTSAIEQYEIVRLIIKEALEEAKSE